MKVSNVISHNNLWDYEITFDGHYDMFFYLGQSYFKSADILLNQPFDESYIHTLIPSIVCYSFAIEYLSCSILEIENIDYPKKTQVHNIKFLFEKFPTNVQKDIISLFNTSNKGQGNNLLKLLDENKSTNKEWRYDFSAQHSNATFLHNYSTCLIKYLTARLSKS